MYKLDEFKQLVKDFGNVADFLVVYIAEAHSSGKSESDNHQQALKAVLEIPHGCSNTAPFSTTSIHHGLQQLVFMVWVEPPRFIQYNFSDNFFFASVSDGWAFNNNFDISQHQSLGERLSAAQILVQQEPLCPVVVDEMSNDAAIKYGALPERLYVLQGGRIVYKVRSKQH